MRLRFFTVPVFDSAASEQALNEFLASQVVLSIDRELVRDPLGTAWAVCVAFQAPTEASKNTTSSKKNRIDYREVLCPEDFVIYAKLRDLRKRLAESQGVPAYALFTNEHLAVMVTQRVTTKAELASIPGVGDARIKNYGEPFLRVTASVVRFCARGA